jgi:hypothetical protein
MMKICFLIVSFFLLLSFRVRADDEMWSPFLSQSALSSFSLPNYSRFVRPDLLAFIEKFSFSNVDSFCETKRKLETYLVTSLKLPEEIDSEFKAVFSHLQTGFSVKEFSEEVRDWFIRELVIFVLVSDFYFFLGGDDFFVPHRSVLVSRSTPFGQPWSDTVWSFFKTASYRVFLENPQESLISLSGRVLLQRIYPERLSLVVNVNHANFNSRLPGDLPYPSVKEKGADLQQLIIKLDVFLLQSSLARLSQEDQALFDAAVGETKTQQLGPDQLRLFEKLQTHNKARH